MPTVKQAVFLTCGKREVLFGGAAGGAKSAALLMGALEWVNEQRVNALILRRTYEMLKLPDALMPLSHEWLDGTAARWNGNDHQWLFPNGSTLTFGHMQHEDDKYRYQGAAFQYVAFDELTHFTRTQYEYVAYGRQRRRAGSPIQIKVRSASNPGGIGHEWVRQHFMIESDPDRAYIPSLLSDNPYLDAGEYRKSLEKFDPITRAQLLHGDWETKPPGGWFQRFLFEVVSEPPVITRAVRYWDLAASVARPGRDPDWTVGCLLGKGSDGAHYVLDVVRFREAPAEQGRIMRQVAQSDARWPNLTIWLEQEGGASGVIAAEHLITNVLKGHAAFADKKEISKEARARPLASIVARMGIRLVRAAWNNDLLGELEAFPMPQAHDDQVDALSGAWAKLSDDGFLVSGDGQTIEGPDGTIDLATNPNGWEGYDLDA